MTTQKRGNFQDEKNYRKGRRSREKVCNLCNAINLEPRHVTACLGLDNRSSKFATKSNFNRFSFLLILNNLNINGINAKSTEDRIKACCCPYWWPIILILSQSFMSKKRTDILKSETWRSSICLRASCYSKLYLSLPEKQHLRKVLLWLFRANFCNNNWQL